MKYFLVYLFGSDEFISIYASSFEVKTSPASNTTCVWFDTGEGYAACFPLSLVHQIKSAGFKLDNKLVFDNVYRLDGCHYEIFD